MKEKGFDIFLKVHLTCDVSVCVCVCVWIPDQLRAAPVRAVLFLIILRVEINQD